jgi:hypothetical protein
MQTQIARMAIAVRAIFLLASQALGSLLRRDQSRLRNDDNNCRGAPGPGSVPVGDALVPLSDAFVPVSFARVHVGQQSRSGAARRGGRTGRCGRTGSGARCARRLWLDHYWLDHYDDADNSDAMAGRASIADATAGLSQRRRQQQK